MSEATSAGDLQQKYKQFLDYTPMATALAGLPASAGRLFSEDQVEGRATTVRAAYRVARTLVEDLTGGDAARYRQLLDLLPLTVALAGLPPSEARLLSEEQIEARAITFKAAYRVARATAKEYLGGS